MHFAADIPGHLLRNF